MIRLAHVWSADLGLLLSIPHVRHLIERGWEVYGICPPGPRIPDIERAGIRWLPHTLERKFVARSDPKAIAGLYNTYRQHRFHIVHSHNAKTGILARVIAAAARVPVVAHTHNGLIYSLGSPAAVRVGVAALERAAAEISDCIFVQSQDDYDTLVKTGGSRPASLELVGNGIDLERFDPSRFDALARRKLRSALGVKDEEVLFFSAGRIVREKGFVELFEAYSMAKGVNPRVRLAIAGPEDLERGLGIPDTILDPARRDGVLLLGERTDMPELFAASDVVVLPSWREGIARVLIEGAAMGKPLIASDARGCRNVVGPEWGLLHPLQDATGLRNAILKLAEDELLREKISKHNRIAARQKYDLKRVLARVDQAYASLLRRRGFDPGFIGPSE